MNLPISESAFAALVTAVGNGGAHRGGRDAPPRRLPAAARSAPGRARIVVAALVSTMVSATIRATVLLTSGVIVGDEYLGAWSVWWAGDAMGIVVVLLMLTTIREQPVPHGWRVLEAIVLAAVLVVISSLIVATDLPVAFLVFPVLGWAAWRFQQLGATPAALLVSVFATWAAAEDGGRFEARPARADVHAPGVQRLCGAHVLLLRGDRERATARAPGAEGAAADLEERVVVRTAELTAANERLAEAQQLAHLGSWDWDVASGAVTWSEDVPDPRDRTGWRADDVRACDRLRRARGANASDRTSNALAKGVG